ncbi:hypothetical protein AB1Y20_014020 [Prymnesium parvum]|uniref:Rhodanese domain-containing protein n=1 Tax=Prymnesium parvum TaxID=97485 RepID=A0AB34IEY1_PRYPA
MSAVRSLAIHSPRAAAATRDFHPPATPLRAPPPRAHAADGTPSRATLSLNPQLDYSLPYRVLAFYAIAPLASPDEAMAAHRRFLAARQMVGRVYVCADGVNAQVSGLAHCVADYREWVEAQLRGAELLFKEDPVAEPAFPRLRVKHKKLVAALPGDEELDLTDRGVDLTPEEWAAMIASQEEQKVVLDVRNGYEWDVGRFDGAARPALDQFAAFDEAAFGLPAEAAKRAETAVMMYCTGGVRCEFFSARLKKSGFKKVYKLQGGVQHYANRMRRQETGTPHWNGSLFVFDRRNTIALGAKGAEPLGHCVHCTASTETFVNCCNVDCNKLHLVCGACVAERRGFCCEACSSAQRRRPLLLNEDEVPDPLAVAAMTQGPPPNTLDPNKLSTFKPHNVRRKEFDVDKDGFAKIANTAADKASSARQG